MEKTCNTCHKTFPLTEDYFRWYSASATYDNKCISCKGNKTETKPRKPYTKGTITPKLLSQSEKCLYVKHKRMCEKHEKKNYTGEVISFYELVDLYVKTQGKCHYTGLEYSLTEKGPLLMTVDRIDSTLGYTKENTCLCCWFVNLAKNAWSLETIVPLWAHLPKQIN